MSWVVDDYRWESTLRFAHMKASTIRTTAMTRPIPVAARMFIVRLSAQMMGPIRRMTAITMIAVGHVLSLDATCVLSNLPGA